MDFNFLVLREAVDKVFELRRLQSQQDTNWKTAETFCESPSQWRCLRFNRPCSPVRVCFDSYPLSFKRCKQKQIKNELTLEVSNKTQACHSFCQNECHDKFFVHRIRYSLIGPGGSANPLDRHRKLRRNVPFIRLQIASKVQLVWQNHTHYPRLL